MATIANILAAQAQEKTDLASLVTLVQNLLTAFASGTITPAQAQSILTEMQSEDTTITGMVTSINAVLNPTPATPSTAAPKAS